MTVDLGRQTKYPYLVVVVGVALMAVGEAYSLVRAFLVREMFRPRAGFEANRQVMSTNGFPFANSLTILATIIAIVGLVWLGLTLRKSPKPVDKSS